MGGRWGVIWVTEWIFNIELMTFEVIGLRRAKELNKRLFGTKLITNLLDHSPLVWFRISIRQNQ